MKQMQSSVRWSSSSTTPAMRTVIRVTLEAAGMTVFGTDVGPAAVALFEQHAPDLVLLDIVMPDMKGLETCSRIRSLPRGNRVPVLIMTEHGDADPIAIAYEHGATDFHHQTDQPDDSSPPYPLHAPCEERPGSADQERGTARVGATDRAHRQLGLGTANESLHHVQ